MKLALLLVLCLLAGAFNAARAQPPPADGQVDDGGSLEEGGEPDDEQGEGSFEGDGPEDGDEGDDGTSDYGDEEPASGEEGSPQPADPKDNPAAARGGRRGFGGRHGGRGGRGGFGGRHGGRGFGGRGGFGRGGFGGGIGIGLIGVRRDRDFRFEEFEREAEIDRNHCSVQASYFLSFNGQRRYCRHATEQHDDCQACCEAATRRETRGADKDDVIGFVTLNLGGERRDGEIRGKREAGLAYGGGERGRERKWECVCCIPKHGRH